MTMSVNKGKPEIIDFTILLNKADGYHDKHYFYFKLLP